MTNLVFLVYIKTCMCANMSAQDFTTFSGVTVFKYILITRGYYKKQSKGGTYLVLNL